MKNLVIGILAHVDAGKTTLSESMLYLCGNIRKLGRVDHGNAFLDTYELEKKRGITIFSKQATLEVQEPEKEREVVKITLLDTPGHVDFSAEMERTLQVLDYAILVINGADGVQGHTRTLWNLLKRYQIPVFLFINKMDQKGTDRVALLEELKKILDDGCMAFDQEVQGEEFWENVAMCQEDALNEYLEKGSVCKDTICQLIAGRSIFPCYFGSALKVKGVQEFLEGIAKYTYSIDATHKRETFGAKVYKISRDAQGNRLTHLKITGGILKVKDMVGNPPDAQEHWEEKVNQIRIYSGEKFQAVKEVSAGTICAVTGLTHTYPGQGLGAEKEAESPVLEPVLTYRILLPEGCDIHRMIANLRQLEEEDPMLQIEWKEELGEIHAKLMGEVQIEVLQSLIKERFGIEVSFGTGNIIYKETIQDTVEGVGHFEPLRHYAEVHLILEPGERGSGLMLSTDCSTDVLDLNWQRLVITHLEERVHKGVLIGAELTDIKITLVAGKAHLKHTEGGDFRQSTYRAVRQGLMQAKSVLLEPYYQFRLEIPRESVGRALTDIQKMHGEFCLPETEGEMSIITGSAPVATMRDYQMEVTGYTKGQGKIYCAFQGYELCHNMEEIMKASGYVAERDLEHPPGSVFCAHGAGFHVPWNQVPDYMHIESQLERFLSKRISKQCDGKKEHVSGRTDGSLESARTGGVRFAQNSREDKELEEIFIRTYGKIERRAQSAPKTLTAPTVKKVIKNTQQAKEYLLVDGYNVIFAWEELKELAKINIESARGRLMDILSNYQGFKRCVLILVFDAYRVEGCQMEIQKYHNIHVVYTKEAETADQYIEKVVHEIGRKYDVTVVTSDKVEQVVTLGQGGILLSSREFFEEVERVNQQIERETKSRRESGKNYLFDHMDEELARRMEEVRLGKKSME